jgi:hypothetical protein
MSNETYTDYQPVSLSPAADGWRAAYIDNPEDDALGVGWSADPLIAWAVYEVTVRPVEGSTARERKLGREIHGVVFGDYPQCPEEMSNFWRYLKPGEPDPSPAEVSAEQARRWPPGIHIPGIGHVGGSR